MITPKFYNKDILRIVSLASFIYLIFSNLIHVYNYFCLDESVTFSLFFSEELNIDPIFEGFIISFFILFSLRIIMGIIFMKEDKSLNKKPEKFDEFTDEELNKYKLIKDKEGAKLLVLGVPLILTASLLNHSLWDSSFSFIMFLTMVINSLILLFNILFFNKLFKDDVEKKANAFIAIGDIAALIITILLFFSDTYNSPLFYLLLGGFLLVFIGELITQYIESLLNAFRELGDIIDNSIKVLKKKFEDS